MIKIKGRIIKTIHGDKDRIYQVIINLLTNAIKYSPNAKKVVISLTPLENKARVSVKDYGIGIKQAYLKKIFKLFYRVSTPEAVTYPGLGVGLYISNEIVKRHKGKFEVKSVYGKGSTFSFSIPYKKQTNSKTGQ